MNIIVEIASDYSKWDSNSEICESFFSNLIEKVIDNYDNFKKLNNIELSVLLTSDSHISKLNNEFRDKDKPTNILSFPDNEFDYKKILEFNFEDDYIYLGDIAISYDRIMIECDQNNISFHDHITHLVIHSILHLLGYDHIAEKDAIEMENLEIKILNKLGISSPY